MARKIFLNPYTGQELTDDLNGNFKEVYDAGLAELTSTIPVNTAVYTVTELHSRLHVVYSGACIITIPTALMTDNFTVLIKHGSGSASVNNITIVGEGGELIDGEASLIINSNYDAVNLYSDGTNLFIY
jgi:hypothetical protein